MKMIAKDMFRTLSIIYDGISLEKVSSQMFDTIVSLSLPFRKWRDMGSPKWAIRGEIQKSQ